MSTVEVPQAQGGVPVLPDTVPVAMPDLPLRLALTTDEQFKAIGDPTRSRILAVIQHQPATAKQLADRLGLSPGTVAHHLQTLETAGLAQLVARRLVRGIVAKYYTRTARLFSYRPPHELGGVSAPALDILGHARDELADALALGDRSDDPTSGFPHARLSPERAREYARRLDRLIQEFASEPADPAGQVYGLCGAFFRAPAYAQVEPATPAAAPAEATEGAPCSPPA